MKTSMIGMRLMPKMQFKPLIRAVLVAFITTIILTALLAGLMVWTAIPQSTTGLGIVLTVIISNILGGFILARKMRANGLIGGAISGLFYSVLLYLVGAIFFNQIDVSTYSLILLLISLFSVSIGGVIGVNARQARLHF